MLFFDFKEPRIMENIPKPILTPKTIPFKDRAQKSMGIIPQNFRSLEFAVSEELGNKHPNRQTHSLTDWCFDREIKP